MIGKIIILHRLFIHNNDINLLNCYCLFKVGLVQSHGYPAEEHYLRTEDGYKLIIHRIPGSPKSPKIIGKPVVLLLHGLFGSSDSWAIMGPNKDLGELLKNFFRVSFIYLFFFFLSIFDQVSLTFLNFA